MTARFLALYQAPADPGAFGRHYREVHIPLARYLHTLPDADETALEALSKMNNRAALAREARHLGLTVCLG